MKTLMLGCMLTAATVSAAVASDLMWDFEGPGSNPPPNWSGGGWFRTQGDLVKPSETASAQVQTPPFRFVEPMAGAGASSHVEDGGIGVGQGFPVSTLITIENFACNPVGDANCLVELIRIDTASSIVATLISGPTDGPVSRTYSDPVIESDGVYSVRFRSYDNDDPDTSARGTDLKITNASLEVALPLTGDYNRNGTVDAADYVLWRKQLGQIVSECSGADGNCNTFIDNNDYSVWRTNFGMSNLGSSVGLQSVPFEFTVSVPEPSVANILTAGLTMLLVRWSRRNIRRTYMPSRLDRNS